MCKPAIAPVSSAMIDLLFPENEPNRISTMLKTREQFAKAGLTARSDTSCGQHEPSANRSYAFPNSPKVPITTLELRLLEDGMNGVRETRA